MARTQSNEVLTTGDVARICHVAPRTVSKWFDTGKLRGYRIPGSRDRRIPRSQLLAFMRAHGMPTDEVEPTKQGVLAYLDERANGLAGRLAELRRFEVRQARCPFEVGLNLARMRPEMLLVGASMQADQLRDLCRLVQGDEELRVTRIVAMVHGPEDPARQRLAETCIRDVVDASQQPEDLEASLLQFAGPPDRQ